MSEKKRIVVTGCGRGLGLAMTAGFVELGHTVLGCSRSPDKVEKLRQQFPGPHQFDVVDVAQDAQVQVWAENVLAGGESPDLLLNNAAIANDLVALWEISVEQFSQVIDVNIKGVFHVVRHFVPAMIQRGRGIIVNFSSGWGRSTSPEVAPYCATKWAIEGLSRSLAQELPSGMAAIPLNPGVINTEMLQGCFGPDASAYPSPEHWAIKAVPFLLGISEKDNGQPLTVPS